MASVNVVTPPEQRPWWRFGYVWLLVSGPLAVVVAGVVTLSIAWSHIDPLVHDAAPSMQAKGQVPAVPSASSVSVVLRDSRHLPAVQGRNHAATPAQDLPD